MAGCNYRLWLANFGVFALILQVGISYSWDSPNLAQLMAPESPIPLTENQGSWLASTTFIGIFVGSLLGAIINHHIGSRRTILVTFSMMSVPWFLLIVVTTANGLYLARLLCGVAVGSAIYSFPLYLGEISPPSVRGSLFTIALAGVPTGTVIGAVAETYLPIKISSPIYLVQCVISIALFLWLMDSPYYLVKKSDEIALARRAILFYNGDCDVEKELLEMRAFVKVNASSGLKQTFREFATPSVRKSSVLIIVLSAMPSVSGAATIVSYMETIVAEGSKNASERWIEPANYVICVNLVGSILSIATYSLIDRIGRRKLLLAAMMSTVVGMSGLGCHFFLLSHSYDPTSIQWLPLLSIFVVLTAQYIGVYPVCNTVLSEIFSDSTKSIASCVSELSEALFTFAMVKLYQAMVDSLGESYTFLLHAALASLSIPVALLMMTETKGESFQEIQNRLTAKAMDCD